MVTPINDLITNPFLWVAAVSSLGTCVAAIFAFLSARTSRRALAMAIEIADRSMRRLAIEYRDGFIIKLPEQSSRIHVFSISLVNPSDRPAAVVKSELRITYSPDEESDAVAVLQHNPDLQHQLPPGRSLMPLPSHPRIDARSVVQGDLLFEVNDELLPRYSILSYEVVITDTDNTSVSFFPAILKELDDEEERA